MSDFVQKRDSENFGTHKMHDAQNYRLKFWEFLNDDLKCDVKQVALYGDSMLEYCNKIVCRLKKTFRTKIIVSQLLQPLPVCI